VGSLAPPPTHTAHRKSPFPHAAQPLTPHPAAHALAAVLYVLVMMCFMAALAVAYRVAFSSTSFNFVSLPNAFFALFAGGFNQAQLPHAAADARPIITLFSLLWPILLCVLRVHPARAAPNAPKPRPDPPPPPPPFFLKYPPRRAAP
jgi:hypothetical protein